MQLSFGVCAAEEEQTGNNIENAFRTILFWAMRGSRTIAFSLHCYPWVWDGCRPQSSGQCVCVWRGGKAILVRIWFGVPRIKKKNTIFCFDSGSTFVHLLFSMGCIPNSLFTKLLLY